MATSFEGRPMELSEEDHRKMQEQLNAGQSSEDEFQKRPQAMKKMATSMDLLFKGPDVQGFFKQRKFSPLSWGTLIVLIITIILLLVVMVAPGWGYTREIRGRETMEGEMYGKYGLWYACWELVDNPGTRVECRLLSELDGIPGWFKGCQAMTVLALLATIIAMGNSAAYICAKSLNGNPKLIASVVVLSCISAVFAIATFVLFAVQFLLEAYWCCASGTMQISQWKLYYCFGICCAVPAFNFGAAIIAAMEVSRLRTIERKAAYAEELERTKAPYGYDPYYRPQFNPQGWSTMRSY